MPELNEVLDQAVDEKKVDGKVVDVTTIDRETEESKIPETVETKPVAEKPAEEKKTPAKKKASVPAKKVDKTETPKTESTETKPAESKAKKAPAKKKEASDGESEDDKEESLRRPPMEQLTKDFERHITTLAIDGHQLKKLEYKCGKIIYGLHNEEGKDFRVIAFKARKKSKTVAGKSRCIFYFGVSKELPALTKKFPGTSTTDFGKCSVQAKKPIQLILDKTTFSEQFGQDIEKVMSTLKGLADATIEQKTEQWKAFQEKVEAKKQASTEKKDKAKPKKSATGDE